MRRGRRGWEVGVSACVRACVGWWLWGWGRWWMELNVEREGECGQLVGQRDRYSDPVH